MNHRLLLLFVLQVALGLLVHQAVAQVTLPPSGGNQKSVVTQYMGLASATFIYHSPDVAAPNGQDRRGKIWGQLVPYGMTNLGFGSATSSPWRAGANENTIFKASHDLTVNGKKLPAGKYGFHVIVGEPGEDWTLIFSSDTEAWGSYFYNPDNDVLRVAAKPVESSYHEYLTYGFADRKLNSCTAHLAWEDLKLPFELGVPQGLDLYVAKLEAELTGQKGFNWVNFNSAAAFCANNNTHLEKGLEWANRAIGPAFPGQKNFTTLSTKAALLTQLNRADEAQEIMTEAVRLPGVPPTQIHQYGRQLLAQGKKDEAMEIFQFNAEANPETWPVNVGLMRGYSALGEYKKALKYAEKALENAPDQLNKDNLTASIEKLKSGEGVN